MDSNFHPSLYNGYANFLMRCLKLIHVGKKKHQLLFEFGDWGIINNPYGY